MKKFKFISKNIKKYITNDFYRARFYYTKVYEETKINKNYILIESFVGNNLNGNPFYILKELCNNAKYDGFVKFVSINKAKEKQAEALLRKYELYDKIELLIRHSKKYCEILASAKYLINNVTFPTYFIRKNEQIYLNTWHGTPLKGLGRNVKDKPHSIGNVQRNFIHATHLLYPNKYTFDIMRKDYMLDNIYTEKYILSGYPRNDILFNEARRREVKNELNLEEKKIIIYMPTWREKLAGKVLDKQLYYIVHALYEFEKNLSEDTIVLVKLHHLADRNINYNDFDKIKKFPEEYETYDVLNIADKLITDYSSVMFDFINRGKEIILYTYDEEEYANTRSMYKNISELPLYHSNDIKEICRRINESDINNNMEYTNEFKQLCKYDSINSTKRICEYIFENKVSDKQFEIIEAKKFCNGKKNILIFSGTLQKNGITSALRALLNNIDLDEYNYILNFYNGATKKNVSFINELDKRVAYIPIMGSKNFRLLEGIMHGLYFRFNFNGKFINKKIENIYTREINRLFRNIKFNSVIHFTGYERHIMHLYAMFECNKIIYTHSNMLNERRTRNNIHLNSLIYAYKKYNKIAVIREGMDKEITNHIKQVDEKKIKLAHNFNNISYIKDKSNEEIKFDEDTISSIDIEELKKILNSDAIKFINIARFSPEKGLDILIKGFSEFNKENENSYLIIIGGHGKDYEKIKGIVEELNNDKIIIIRSLSNPFAILKKTDCFVLSSHYEGLPMTIFEALILDKKVICTDITGPREFLSKGYGYLVEKTPEGICKGMRKFKETGLKELKKFNAEEFNQKALKEFYRLIK